MRLLARGIPSTPFEAASCRVLAAFFWLGLAARFHDRRAALIHLIAKLGRQIGSFRIAAELQRAEIRDDGPAVTWRNLRRVAQHLSETIGRDVVNIAIGCLAKAVLMIAWRRLHAAHDHEAIAVALQTVAGRAENLVALFPALEKFEVHGQWKIVRILRHKEFVVGKGTPRDGVFDRRSL